MTTIKKTSSDWNKEKKIQIINYGGWHHKDFHYAWYEELITEKQFEMRVNMSVIKTDGKLITPAYVTKKSKKKLNDTNI